MNTTVSEGKSKSAWDITSKAFLEMATAMLKGDKDSAKAKLTEIGMASKDHNEFAMKLSAFVVGKDFRIKVVGEEIEGGKGRFIKSSFASSPGLAEPIGGTSLKFYPEKNIKRLPSADQIAVNPTATATVNDLPF